MFAMMLSPASLMCLLAILTHLSPEEATGTVRPGPSGDKRCKNVLLFLQAERFREGYLLYSALAAMRRHAERTQLARAAILRLVHKQLALAWAVWTMTVQASIPTPHTTMPTFCTSRQPFPDSPHLQVYSSILHAFRKIPLHVQEMAQRRMAAEALQRKALSRMLGLSLRSSFGAWRRLTGCMISARGLLRRHLLALQQGVFTAWRCAVPVHIVCC